MSYEVVYYLLENSASAGILKINGMAEFSKYVIFFQFQLVKLNPNLIPQNIKPFKVLRGHPHMMSDGRGGEGEFSQI